MSMVLIERPNQLNGAIGCKLYRKICMNGEAAIIVKDSEAKTLTNMYNIDIDMVLVCGCFMDNIFATTWPG
jgi:hypothetical protein